MIAIIRISGEVGINRDVEETLNRLRLKKKYSCVVIPKLSKEQLGMIKKVRNFVAFGDIKDETFKKLVDARGKPADKTKGTDMKKAADKILEGKNFKEANLKPFFRLHPPRGGIESKKNFGVRKGVLGNNKEKINDLIERML